MLKISRTIFNMSKIKNAGLTARKYLRSVSESALHYKPTSIRQLNQNQSIKDRVVQQFFDSSSLVHRIQVFQAGNRLNIIDKTSTPSHSFYQVRLPFKQNLNLRKKMVQFFQKYIRVGRILELMDYIAANVAYRYCSTLSTTKQVQELPFVIVTAAIDQIDFFYPIMADVNCSFSGYVSYVGTSSMEVQIAVTQQMEGKQRLSCSAKFVMAARDKKTGKSHKVPSIELSSQPQNFIILKQLGEIRQKVRKTQAARALKITPPTYQQSSQVHNLLLKIQSQQKNKQNWIKMSETIQKTTLIMHLQDKNLSGKIFGGFIMRLAYQLGWLTVYRFLKGELPRCTYIDDVQFFAPVQIGSIVQLKSIISYIDQDLIHIIVQCKNASATGETNLTNILRINFQHQQENIKRVYPVTLQESTQYIQSMRRVKKYLQN